MDNRGWILNYTDFGVTCAEELEQDEWSLYGGVDGGRPTFETPKGGLLTVVGWKGKKGSHKHYILECDKCAGDRELFGDGVFKSLKGVMVKGGCSCGCSFNPKLTEAQSVVIAKRAAEKRGYSFLGWVGGFNGVHTKCHLICHEHGEWKSTSLGNLRAGKGCIGCANAKMRLSTLRDNASHIEEFMSTGKFLAGTRFWREGRATGRWSYICPKCSNDEYVVAGLCCGKFSAAVGHLKSGRLSCRCSPAYRWTQEQREHQIKNEMVQRSDKEPPNFKFVGWKSRNGYTNSESGFIFSCSRHGDQVVSVANFLYRHQGCPLCAGKNQQQCYLHQVKDNGVPVALKLGIARDWQGRLRGQNMKNLFQAQNIGVWEFENVDDCKSAERECKQTLKTGVLSSREMKDGWTETVSTLDLDKVIAIYEKHGGERIR